MDWIIFRLNCLIIASFFKALDEAQFRIDYVRWGLLTSYSMHLFRGAIVAFVIPWLRSLINLKASSIVSHGSSLSLLNSLYQVHNIEDWHYL